MTQLHKRFADDQIKVLLNRYCQGLLGRGEIQEIPDIGKTRFFAMLKEYRQDPEAFSVGYERNTQQQASKMLQGRWTWRAPSAPEPLWERDVPFWTIPGTDRQLLCDVWQPAASIEPSGLAILYFHGSGWYLLDKDFGTRQFFRHLAGQGHVVVDVAYRLCPEVEIRGMVGDVKRAIAWMKANARPAPQAT